MSHDACLAELSNSTHNVDTVTCNVGETYSLSSAVPQCTPSDKTRNTSYNFVTLRRNTSRIGYELISEELVNIPGTGHHVFPSTNNLTLQQNDLIGWTSDGGWLSFIADETRVTLEFPLVGQIGAKFQANNYTKMDFGSHALTAYIREPLKFELYHTYQNPGVYPIRSSVTPTMSITIDYPISSFTLNVPKLSQTNSTVFFIIGLHNGTGVTYFWNFGDNSTVNSTKPNVTHVYTYPGQYLITLYALNSVTRFSVNASIEILDPIQDCRIRPMRAVAFETPIMLKWHCACGSKVTFFVNFGDGHTAKLRPTSEIFVGNNFSYTYASAGHYEVEILASSPLGVNATLTEQVLVEIPVGGLEVQISNSTRCEVLYIATLSELWVERVLERGSHVKCTFYFGDSHLSITSTYGMVNHTYKRPGTYHVNVTCYNHVSSTWSILNTSIIAENILPLKNLTLNTRPTILGETTKFELVIPHGNLFSCEWDLGYNTTHTTSYPQVNIHVSHRYHQVGTHNVFVACRNELGEVSLTALANVDEPIRNVSLVNPYSFVEVKTSAEFILQMATGSRVKFCVGCDSRSHYERLDANVTMATITHAYTTAGKYSVSVKLWNSVSSVIVTALRPLTVLHPVTGIAVFTVQPKRCSSLDVGVCLNLPENSHPPSNASIVINYGDNSIETYKIAHFTSQVCFEEHKYAHAGIYNITANISNHVSRKTFALHNTEVRNNALKGIDISFKNDSVFEKGLGPNGMYFPAGSILKFEIEGNRYDLSYDWRIGNQSFAAKRVIENVFFHSGCPNVTIVIESLTLDEACFESFCIEEIIVDLDFNVTKPTYFKDATIFNFSVKNNSVSSCFGLNFGDNTSLTFGPSNCAESLRQIPTSYKHAYKQRGKYTVTLTRWNHVSKITRSLEVPISDEACESVGVHIAGGGFKDRPVNVKESEELVLDAHVSYKCHVAKVVSVHWSVSVWNFDGEGQNVASNWREIVIDKNSSEYLTSEFVISGSSFATGSYIATVTVGFIEVDRNLENVTGSNYTWFEISRPPLVARIKGKLFSIYKCLCRLVYFS